MKKILKIEILLIITFLLVQVILVNKSFASITSGNYKYDQLSDGTISIVGYTGAEETITVPSTIDGKNVTMIGLLAFENNSTVKKIILPEGILKLDAYAFDSCPNLTTVKMPSTLNYISNIFKNACPKLTDYTIPSSLTLLSSGEYRKIVNMNTSGTYNYDSAKEIVKLVNEERAKINLSPLQIDDSLMESAMQRASEISIYWDHERPNGLSCFSVNKKINGENIGVGSSSTINIMNKWMNSPGHKAQIVKNTYNSIGVGCYNHNGLTYWVQLFSKSNSNNTNTSAGKKDVSNTIQVAVGDKRVNPVIRGFETNNILSIGETIAPTSVKNKNAGYTSAQTVIAFSDLTWKSSNTNVFTVDANGTVTAIGEGEAILTASIGDFTTTYNITVRNPIPDDYKIKLNYSEYQINSLNETVTLSDQYLSGNSITWKSTNEKVATVDENGKVTPKNGGFTYIDATTENYGSSRCWVYVCTLITLNDGSKAYAGDLDRNGTINANDAALIQNVFLTGSDDEALKLVADIDGNGIINANDTALILDIYKSGSSFVVGKYNPIQSVVLNKTDIELETGVTSKLTATYTPIDTTDSSKLTWTSSNEKVATVDSTGNVTAIRAGKATITVRTSNDKTATCDVIVPGLVYTTIPTTEISQKEVMTFKSKTGFESILNAENFPILDANYEVELYDMSDNTKDNSSKVGSKNIIKIKDLDGVVVAEYMAIVKGDVTGNGFSRMYDAFQILKDSLFNGKLDEIDMLIRDYDGNGHVRMYDAFQFLKDSLFN